MEFCFNLQGLPSPLLWVKKLANVPAFDTSTILFQAAPECAGFALETEGSHASLAPIQIKNTHPSKAVIFTHIKISLTSPDARILPNSATAQAVLQSVNINQFFATGRGSAPAQSAFGACGITFGLAGYSLTVPEVYNSSFVIQEVAGLAYTPGSYGVTTNVDFAALIAGNVMESFKMTPNFSIPFNGTVLLIPN